MKKGRDGIAGSEMGLPLTTIPQLEVKERKDKDSDDVHMLSTDAHVQQLNKISICETRKWMELISGERFQG